MDDSRVLFTAALLVITSLLATGANAECGVHRTCDECIQLDPTCSWCNGVNVLLAFARNSSSTGPAQLCGTEAELTALNCQNIINPATTSSMENAPPADTGSYVSITNASVNVRPGDPARVEVTVSPPASAAVDMYILVDLSLTMLQNINILRDLADELVMTMKNLSSDFRVGFGSFIDKPVPPYADRFSTEFPCAVDAALLGVNTSSCEPVYSFRHVLDFTNNGTALETALIRSKLSASPDNPESVLDAILQSAVCEAQLGWRPQGQSQRFIVAFTDGDYHYALDGKIGGILSQATMECRLDPITHEYTTSNLFDYPSSGLISEVLNDRLITPIFAVPSGVQEVYRGLAASIRSATVGVLSSSSEEILSLIENQYRILSGTVVPILRPTVLPAGIGITVLPMDGCGSGNLQANTSDVCVGIDSPNSVTYVVEVSASPEACSLPQPIRAQIEFIRFGAVTININLQCNCDCDPEVANSEVCSNQGTLQCSTCICNDEDMIGGAVCECPLGVAGQPDIGCRDPQDDEGRVCNGRGTCNCGQCQCDPISEGSQLSFQGPFCQFNPQNCPLGRANDDTLKPCAGSGVCDVNSNCQCFDGFTGGVCDCPTSNSTCMNPGSTGEAELCSGEGQCICGLCICNNYSVNFGAFCEECLPCRTSCSVVSPCVLCHVREGVGCPPDLNCTSRLQVNDTTDLASTAGFKVCSLREGSCEVRYYLGTNVRGGEDMIQIFLDSTQGSLGTLRGGSSGCNSAAPIWPIFVGIILGTIFVGILVIILWRGCTYLGEYLEYQQWSKSIKDDTERSGENPLFIDPTSEYSNPRYRPVSST